MSKQLIGVTRLHCQILQTSVGDILGSGLIGLCEGDSLSEHVIAVTDLSVFEATQTCDRSNRPLSFRSNTNMNLFSELYFCLNVFRDNFGQSLPYGKQLQHLAQNKQPRTGVKLSLIEQALFLLLFYFILSVSVTINVLSNHLCPQEDVTDV